MPHITDDEMIAATARLKHGSFTVDEVRLAGVGRCVSGS